MQWARARPVLSGAVALFVLLAPLARIRATLAVALSATAFIYSSEVYPELPAGLALLWARCWL